VHVRVLYHVGSKDEQPDRQGFAHMFEHMMFRGSAHVKPEEHMKTIGAVGGYCNAFTSFDQTVYHDTLPAPYLETALYLEADRMASFKVSPEIFRTEKLVVAQEWALRMNQPYGMVYAELLKRVFTQHSYQWEPIGNMDQLALAATSELQAFFNHYYVPNNAVLVVAGNIEIPATKEMVHRYFAWIPKGDAIVRRSLPEPDQTEARRAEIAMRVPLSRVMIAYPMPAYVSDDQDALGLLGVILGEGRSSRLSRKLVTSEQPLCTTAETMMTGLEDGGTIGVSATVLEGKSVADVEHAVQAVIADLREHGVTEEELAKAKQQSRSYLAKRRETAENVATEFGDEALFRADPARVNTEEQRLAKLTTADVLAVAKKYLQDQHCTTLIIKSDPAAPRMGTGAAASQPATAPAVATPVSPRAVTFPEGYPTTAPRPDTVLKGTFAKGTESTIDGVKVIVMSDHRLPVVNWSLTMRMGSLAEPAGKEGTAGLTSAMVRRGPVGTTYDAFNEDMESRAISLEVSSGDDTTRIAGNCLSEQLPYAVGQMRRLLLEPAFSAEEFAKLKAQSLSGLRMSLNSPTAVAGRELASAIYGGTPLGRASTPESIASITLDDVKAFHAKVYRSTDAILMLSGDVTVEDGQKLARALIADWKGGDLAKPTFELPKSPEAPRIILVDRADSRQTNIRFGTRAYSITSDEKFAGSLASQILSSGIDSRLGKYVRAERGLTYSVSGIFSPTRQDGTFMGSVDTRIETTADAVEAMYKVFDTMKAEKLGDQELAEAKLRIAGGMIMQMQTVAQQATRRVDGILNGYPVDYYDNYAERIGKVTAEEIRGVMAKYVDEAKMSIVVVGPAAAVQPQLERLGKVTVVPMPLLRAAPGGGAKPE